MAYFTARSDQPAAFCAEQVQRCDVYVGIIGFRYGSPVRDRADVSYTELEYETAKTTSKARLVFSSMREPRECRSGQLLGRLPTRQGR
jgi:hypothetical protein